MPIISVALYLFRNKLNMFFARYVILGMLLIQPFVTSIWGNYNKPILLKIDGCTDPLVVDNFTPFLTWS